MANSLLYIYMYLPILRNKINKQKKLPPNNQGLVLEGQPLLSVM